MVRRKAKEQDEAEATGKPWVEIREQQEELIPRQVTEPTAVTNHPESSKVETAAVATGNFLEQMGQMLGVFGEKIQSVTDAINIMDAQNDVYMESIEQRYNENDNDELDQKKYNKQC